MRSSSFLDNAKLIKGKSFNDSIDDLIYAIGFLVSLAFIGYLFFIFVIKKNP